MLRTDIIDVFNTEMSGKFTIVTNGTFRLIPYSGLINYWVSIDGMKEKHDKIRGNSFDKINENITNYFQETGKLLGFYTDQLVEAMQHINTYSLS